MLVPDEVFEYIATHLTSHARELSGAMNRLHLTSQAWRTPVTREMAEEALAELIRHNRRAPRLADIEKAVCQTFGLEADSLQSARKAKAVSHPRMLAMWLARKHTRAALSEIGQYFGQRRHSTVISAQKKVGQWVAKQAAVEVADQRLNIEDAIRRVEANLRAG
jgi:chromosomal replication initiator protein